MFHSIMKMIVAVMVASKPCSIGVSASPAQDDIMSWTAVMFGPALPAVLRFGGDKDVYVCMYSSSMCQYMYVCM